MIDSSIQTFIVANVSSPWIVQEGKVDFDKSVPFVWFRRSFTEQERWLDGRTSNNFTTTFDVECVGEDIDDVQETADSLKTAFQSLTPGSIVGATYCQAIFVNDHNDDYISRVILSTDTGLHLCSFQLEIYHQA